VRLTTAATFLPESGELESHPAYEMRALHFLSCSAHSAVRLPATPNTDRVKVLASDFRGQEKAHTIRQVNKKIDFMSFSHI
jgi:hypothetical protein